MRFTREEIITGKSCFCQTNAVVPYFGTPGGEEGGGELVPYRGYRYPYAALKGMVFQALWSEIG